MFALYHWISQYTFDYNIPLYDKIIMWKTLLAARKQFVETVRSKYANFYIKCNIRSVQSHTAVWGVIL